LAVRAEHREDVTLLLLRTQLDEDIQVKMNCKERSWAFTLLFPSAGVGTGPCQVHQTPRGDL